jgi:hypothetical protein
MLTRKEEQANVQNGFGAPAAVIAVAWRDGVGVQMRPEQCRESQRQVDVAQGSDWLSNLESSGVEGGSSLETRGEVQNEKCNVKSAKYGAVSGRQDS